MPYLSINEVTTCFRTPNTCTSRLLTDKKLKGLKASPGSCGHKNPKQDHQDASDQPHRVDPVAAILQLVWGPSQCNSGGKPVRMT